jgi:hypothetical protein
MALFIPQKCYHKLLPAKKTFPETYLQTCYRFCLQNSRMSGTQTHIVTFPNLEPNNLQTLDETTGKRIVYKST